MSCKCRATLNADTVARLADKQADNHVNVTLSMVGDGLAVESIEECPLHAAAPALLEALEGMLFPFKSAETLEGGHYFAALERDVVAKARAAITRAKEEA